MAMEQMMGEKPKAKKDIKSLLNQVGSGLAEIADMINSNEGMGEEDKAAISEIMASYIDFVENKLGASEESEPEKEPMGMKPAMQGEGVPVSNMMRS